ncbi:MAG TPA: hypothetical protein VK029_08455 [Pseudogracilibacillus sp.]|nr:hypothetical protein [Pseudogracilibacillus sp.]
MFEIVFKMMQVQLLQIFHGELFLLNGPRFLTIILVTVGFIISIFVRRLFANGPYYILVYIVSTLFVFMVVTLFQDETNRVVTFEQLIIANVYYGILFAIYLLYRFVRDFIRL